jgi:hypothetical protein
MTFEYFIRKLRNSLGPTKFRLFFAYCYNIALKTPLIIIKLKKSNIKIKFQQFNIKSNLKPFIYFECFP